MIKTITGRFTKRTTNILLALFIAFWQLAVPVLATKSVYALDEHCPDHNGHPGKVEDGSSDNDLVLPAGTIFCVKAGNPNSNPPGGATGKLTADGITTLQQYLFNSGIVDGSGNKGRDVSYYIVYEKDDVPKPDLGSIKVNKKIDTGQGYVDDNPSEFGFLWGLDSETPSTPMGTSREKPVGSYAVTENDVDGYEFTGWYHTYNEQYSCLDPESTSLPSDVIVRKGETIEVTLCNKKTETPEPKLGKIRGFKFEDMNGNGKFDKDQNETKISGWKIYIDKDLDGEFDDSKLTNQDGGYAFRDLPAGTYRICEEQPAGWKQTYPSGDGCHEIVLGEGEDHKGVKFGNHKLKDNPEPTYGSITVIKDADPNNAQDFHFTIKKEAKCDDQVAISALANVPCLTDVAGFNLDDDRDPIPDNRKVTTGLTPGYYVITEDPTSGWTLDDISCEAEKWEPKENTVTVKLLGTEKITCTFTNVKDTPPVVPEEPQNPTVPQVLGDVDVKESFVPQTLSTSTLANTGEKDAARGSVFAMTIAGAALATLFTRRKEAKE